MPFYAKKILSSSLKLERKKAEGLGIDLRPIPDLFKFIFVVFKQ